MVTESASDRPPSDPPARVDAQLAAATDRLIASLGLSRPEARREARILAAHGLGVTTAWLVAHDRDQLTPAQSAVVDGLVQQRADGIPVAYLLGSREFHGRPFRVTPAVLIPRPETEHLVEAALARLPADRPASVLDIGTGSGCVAISLALERPAWTVSAVDISPAALEVAADNGRRLAAQVNWQLSNLFAYLAGARYDLIVSNPPYVAANDAHLTRGDLRHEPPGALASGVDGLDALRAIVEAAPTYLNEGGWLLLEHGHEQGGPVRRLLAERGFEAIFTETDLAGLARISGGRQAAH